MWARFYCPNGFVWLFVESSAKKKKKKSSALFYLNSTRPPKPLNSFIKWSYHHEIPSIEAYNQPLDVILLSQFSTMLGRQILIKINFKGRLRVKPCLLLTITIDSRPLRRVHLFSQFISWMIVHFCVFYGFRSTSLIKCHSPAVAAAAGVVIFSNGLFHSSVEMVVDQRKCIGTSIKHLSATATKVALSTKDHGNHRRCYLC